MAVTVVTKQVVSRVCYWTITMVLDCCFHLMMPALGAGVKSTEAVSTDGS